RQVVETTVEIANKVGVSEVISRIVEGLKDDNEPYRRMVMETIEQVIQNLGAADIDPRLEDRLMDGILFAFQEQVLNVDGVWIGDTSDCGVLRDAVRCLPMTPRHCLL
ncbi:unnamed protein product, partial [Hapterophycus canaliculatus]